uniref:kinase/pyrophosphorylase n=1 Tax=Staphylococcus capitis TaxID=29388 RepID=UPI001642851B
KKGYKIANMGLVVEVAIGENVFEEKGVKVFGLSGSRKYIGKIGGNGGERLGLCGECRYNSLEGIKKEVCYGEEVLKKLNGRVMNSEYKCIEECGFYIEKFLMEG